MNDYESYSSLPSWYEELLQDIAGRGYAASNVPYTPYGGQRLAPFTPQQQQAFDLTSQQVGQYKPMLQQAGALTQQSSTYDPNQLNKFLSPYTQGVVEEIGRLGNRNFQENILPQTMASFTGAGQFGSTRSQDAAARAARDVQADILGRQQGALQQAYQQAQGAYSDWAGKGLAGAEQMAGLAKTGQSLGTADIAALGAAGKEQQQMGQQNLDWAYNQFQEQRDYPKQQLGWLSGLARGIPASSMGSTANYGIPQPGPSTFSTVLGGLTQALGTMKAGGRVRRRRRLYGRY